ncbi:MAG: ABC transporter permease, partial [Planctomycetota bacterium]
MLSTIRALVAKDVRLFARDRTALFFAFALPIVLASVMGTALGAAMGGGGGSSGGVQRIGLAVEDRDGTDASRALVEALEAAAGLSVEITDDARRRVADGERAAALVVPAGYGATLDAGEQPSLDLFRDPARQIASQVVVFQLAPVLFERHGAAQGRGMMSGFLDALDFPEDARAAAEAALERSYDEVEALAQGAEPDVDAAEEPSEDIGGFDVMQDAPRLLGLEVTDLAPERDDGIPRSAGASH